MATIAAANRLAIKSRFAACCSGAHVFPLRSGLMFDEIEQLKRDYTDQRVVVIGDRPELARFVGVVGRIKTINMNGRALVEFDAWNNTGWYDISLEYLRIADPLPGSEAALSRESSTESASAAGQISEHGPEISLKREKTTEKAGIKPVGVDGARGEGKFSGDPRPVSQPSAAEEPAPPEIPTVTHESGPEAPVVD